MVNVGEYTSPMDPMGDEWNKVHTHTHTPEKLTIVDPKKGVEKTQKEACYRLPTAFFQGTCWFSRE